MNTRIQNERGVVLVVTLMIMGMLAILTALALRTADTDMELSFNQHESDQAFYIAEAGAQTALLALNTDNAWRTGYSDVAFGGGSYSVWLADSTADSLLFDTVVIGASGQIKGAVSEVQIWTAPEYIHPFKFAMFAEAGINLDRNTCTDSYNSDSGTYAATVLDSAADIGSNGTVTSAKDVNFGGGISVATHGGISLGAHNTVNGDTTSSADSVNLDIIPDSEYDWAKANSNAPAGLSGTNFTYNNGDKSLSLGNGGSVELQSGVYYFSTITTDQLSKITLAPGAAVTIYVTGDIVMRQGSTMNASGNPSDFIVYSQGSKLQFDQDNVFVGAFYGPNAYIQYDQTTQVFGALIGNSIQLDQDACLHYDRFLGRIKKGTTGRMMEVAWCMI